MRAVRLSWDGAASVTTLDPLREAVRGVAGPREEVLRIGALTFGVAQEEVGGVGIS